MQSTIPYLSLSIWIPIASGLALLAIGRDDRAPLIRWLKLDCLEDPDEELAKARRKLAAAGAAVLTRSEGREADALRYTYALERGRATAGSGIVLWGSSPSRRSARRWSGCARSIRWGRRNISRCRRRSTGAS